MKSTLLYTGLFLASLLTAAEIVLLVVPHNADRAGSPGTTAPARPESRKDSLVAKIDTAVSKRDTVTVSAKDTLARTQTKHEGIAEAKGLRDSLELLRGQLAAEQNKVVAMEAKSAADTAHADSSAARERKVVAKLLEAMDAQGAAKILHTLDDKEVKEILFAVKKRQAGKILSSLDPERAARIIR